MTGPVGAVARAAGPQPGQKWFRALRGQFVSGSRLGYFGWQKGTFLFRNQNLINLPKA